MARIDEIRKALEERKTKRLSQPRRYLLQEDVIEEMKQLFDEGYSATAIADSYNLVVAPTFEVEEITVTKNLFKSGLPEGAIDNGNDTITYKRRPKFTPEMIRNALGLEKKPRKKSKDQE